MIGEDLTLKHMLTRKVGKPIKVYFIFYKKMPFIMIMLVSFVILGCGQTPPPITIPTKTISIPTASNTTPNVTGTRNVRAKSTVTPSSDVTPSPDVTQPPTCPEGMAHFPAESVCLDIYEVTNGAYQECVDAGVCTEPDETNSVTRRDEVYYGNAKYDNYPVVRVTWHQADQYCQHVGKRLPTAAEWDMAADYEGFPSLGEAMGRSDDTLKVGSTGDVSPEGVHNLGDNVVEWVDASDKKKSSEKVVKGYSFYSYSIDQISRPPDSQDWGIGFRCAAKSQ